MRRFLAPIFLLLPLLLGAMGTAHAERVPVRSCHTRWTGIYDGSAGIHARAHTVCHTRWVTKPTPKPALDAKLWPSVRRWSALIFAASRATGVNADLIGAVMEVESGGQVTVSSATGAQGLMQIEPETFVNFDGGTDGNPWTPATNILVGARILAYELRVYGNVSTALEAYNGWGYGYAANVLGRLS